MTSSTITHPTFPLPFVSSVLILQVVPVKLQGPGTTTKIHVRSSDPQQRQNIYSRQITKIEVKKMQNKRKTKRKTLAHKQPHNRTRCRQGNHSQKGKKVCNSKWIKDSPGNPRLSPPPKTFWQINIAGCPIGNWTEKLEKDIPGHGDTALHSMSTTAERKSGEVFSVSVM